MSENSKRCARAGVMFMLEKITSNLFASNAGITPSQSWFWNVQLTFILTQSAFA